MTSKMMSRKKSTIAWVKKPDSGKLPDSKAVPFKELLFFMSCYLAQEDNRKFF